jgi:5-methylcytosine-specific restriction endonuclease McrA
MRKLILKLEWKDWRRKVFERDNYFCRECGEKGYLEPHHIIPLRTDISKAFDVDNGITLCRPYHKKTILKEEQFIDKYSKMIIEGEK